MIHGKIILTGQELRRVLTELAADRLGLKRPGSYWVTCHASVTENGEIERMIVTVESERENTTLEEGR